MATNTPSGTADVPLLDHNYMIIIGNGVCLKLACQARKVFEIANPEIHKILSPGYPFRVTGLKVV